MIHIALTHCYKLEVFCLSNAMHCMGQNIKSLAACFCVSVCLCERTGMGAEYLENG